MIRALIVILALTEAGWMAFDGTRALVKGDYVTPTSGAHAGQLGPWSRVVEAVGVSPRSPGMKVFFVLFGVVWLGVTASYALAGTPAPGLRRAMLGLAVGSLWYLPVGTVLGVAQVALLLWRG